MTIRTDLAIEAREMYQDLPEGVECQNVEMDKIKITRVKITSDRGAEKIGKPVGNYITIEAAGIRENDREIFDRVSEALSDELRSLINVSGDSHILAAGLGNRFITPDSIGPKAVAHLLVTRHLKELMPEAVDDSLRPVSAVAPGVLGLTGIETGEIIKGIVDKIKPSLVIVIDALASRRMERVGASIQIADTGISPGSGVGNNRRELSLASLGVPVIAIGVPMVVDAASVANDAIELVIGQIRKEAAEDSVFKLLDKLSQDEQYELIYKAMQPSAANMIVTPKEVDALSERVSKVIADGINRALQSALDKEDIEKYLS